VIDHGSREMGIEAPAEVKNSVAQGLATGALEGKKRSSPADEVGGDVSDNDDLTESPPPPPKKRKTSDRKKASDANTSEQVDTPVPATSIQGNLAVIIAASNNHAASIGNRPIIPTHGHVVPAAVMSTQHGNQYVPDNHAHHGNVAVTYPTGYGAQVSAMPPMQTQYGLPLSAVTHGQPHSGGMIQSQYGGVVTEHYPSNPFGDFVHLDNIPQNMTSPDGFQSHGSPPPP
jgi:hypothetical protein